MRKETLGHPLFKERNMFWKELKLHVSLERGKPLSLHLLCRHFSVWGFICFLFFPLVQGSIKRIHHEESQYFLLKELNVPICKYI